MGTNPEPGIEANSVQDLVEVPLYDTATDGRGVGRLPSGKVILVRGGLAGEQVQVRLEEEGARLAQGRVEKLENWSSLRQRPPCPLAARCGGCQLQHVTPEGQLTLKKQWLLQTLRRVGGWSDGNLERARALLRCQQASCLAYRVRTRWHFDGERLGFFAPRSHQVISGEGCMLLAPGLESARSRLSGKLCAPFLRRLYRRAGMVGLQIEATLLEEGGVALRLCGLVCRHREGRRWLAGRLKAMLREWNGGSAGSFLKVAHPAEKTFLIGTRGFVQPHREALALYRQEIVGRLRELLSLDPFQALRRAPSWTAWDLYCGAGALSDLPQLVAEDGNQVTTWVVDGEKSSIAALCRNHPGLASQARVEDVHGFIRARLGDQQWPDIVIADPPRSGMGRLSSEMLSGALARRKTPTLLVWLACDNASLARDLGLFLEAGFRLHSMALFDCFAYTVHAETVTVMWCPAAA